MTTPHTTIPPFVEEKVKEFESKFLKACKREDISWSSVPFGGFFLRWARKYLLKAFLEAYEQGRGEGREEVFSTMEGVNNPVQKNGVLPTNT